MDCLAATYEWKATSASTKAAANVTVAPSLTLPCRAKYSSAEREVQQLKAKAELDLLRDRVRKASIAWLGEPLTRKPNAAPIRFEWQVLAKELARHLCYWHYTSALSVVEMTPCLAELTRDHRKHEGAPVPPASKNVLTLVVWNLAAIVDRKLRQWEACVKAKTEDEFDGAIVVRVSNLVPIWSWEADILRHRPQLTSVCDRMLSTELYQYRKLCGQLTQREKIGVLRTQAIHLRDGAGTSSTSTDAKPRKPHPSSIRSKSTAAESSADSNKRSGKVFAGATFCVSGAFTISQSAMLSLISKNGGAIATTANRSCTYVVAESIGSQKTRRAQAAGIPIVTEDWIRASIKDGKQSTDPLLFLSGGKRSASNQVARNVRSDTGHDELEEEADENADGDDDDGSYVEGSWNGRDSEDDSDSAGESRDDDSSSADDDLEHNFAGSDVDDGADNDDDDDIDEEDSEEETVARFKPAITDRSSQSKRTGSKPRLPAAVHA